MGRRWWGWTLVLPQAAATLDCADRTHGARVEGGRLFVRRHADGVEWELRPVRTSSAAAASPCRLHPSPGARLRKGKGLSCPEGPVLATSCPRPAPETWPRLARTALRVRISVRIPFGTRARASERFEWQRNGMAMQACESSHPHRHAPTPRNHHRSAASLSPQRRTTRRSTLRALAPVHARCYSAAP